MKGYKASIKVFKKDKEEEIKDSPIIRMLTRQCCIITRKRYFNVTLIVFRKLT